MNILILTDYYPPDKLGGVGEIAKNLKTTFDNMGHDTWVLTTGSSTGEQNVIRSSASLIKGVFINNLKVRKLVKEHNIDVINMHQSSTTLFLLTKHIPFLRKKLPKIVNSFQVSYFSEFAHIRSVTVKDAVYKPAKKEYIEKWIYAPMHIVLDFIGFVFADAVTVVSNENKKEFDRSYGRLSRKKIQIIPNGINTADFQPQKPNLEQSFLRQLKGKTVLLYVGVFRVRKRVFNLIWALHEAVKQNTDVMLVLVGGGRDYEQDILDLVAKLDLEKNVLFVGRVPNEKVVDYLNSADVFCTLSSYEGMPIAILEAMAGGKAILTSKASGMIDLITDGTDGYLTEVDNLIDISQKLQLLIDDPKKTKAMGNKARQKTKQTYEWSLIAEQYEKAFAA